MGKTCLLISYSTNCFPAEYVPTVFDNYGTNVMYGQTPIALNLWDTAGQEDYSSLRPLSYPQTDVFLLCFSIISRVSFANLITWKAELAHYAPSVPVLLVGTKSDLRTDKMMLERLAQRKEVPVTSDEAQAKAAELGCEQYCEVSALSQKGLHAMVSCLFVRPGSAKTYLSRSSTRRFGAPWRPRLSKATARSAEMLRARSCKVLLPLDWEYMYASARKGPMLGPRPWLLQAVAQAVGIWASFHNEPL